MGLPFGWAPAPAIFTKFMRPLLGALRNPHVIRSPESWLIFTQAQNLGEYFVSAYLDDLIGMAVGSYATNLLCAAVIQCF